MKHFTPLKPAQIAARRVYFKVADKYHIGTVIGTRRLVRVHTNIFGGERREWNESLLLIEDSHRHRLNRWESETFEAEAK